MTKTLISVSLVALLSGASAAAAETVGVSFAAFDDNFHTVMRTKIQEYADGLDGVDVQFEDAQYDVGKQLDQVNNFIASGVDAIMMTLIDTTAAPAITAAAEAAGVPLVYMNLQPVIGIPCLTIRPTSAGTRSSPARSALSRHARSCGRSGLSDGARGYILIGNLAHQAAVQRTKDVHDVTSMDMCKFMEITDEQTGKWSREEGQNLYDKLA